MTSPTCRAIGPVGSARGGQASAHCFAILTVALAGPALLPAQDSAPSLQQQYEQETARFESQLDHLASGPLADSLARPWASWHIPRAADRQTIFLPPHLASPSQARQLPAEFTQLLHDHAQRLWQLSQQAVAQQEWQFAYRLAMEVLAADPSHEAARRVAGNGRDAATDGTLSIELRRATQRHPLTGWPAGRYWTAVSDHFVIDSNDSAPAVQSLARTLEIVHAVWRQAFVDFWATREEIEDLLAGSGAPRPAARHHIVLFRSRDQYRRALRAREPRIGMTLGLYWPADKTTYLISQPQEPRDQVATWRHEATHQLFQECDPQQGLVAERGHAWIVEGAALYMESLQVFERCATLGGVDAPRLQHARYRSMTEGKHEPLERLKTLGREQLQARDDVRGLYSEAAGLTHFLFDGAAGALRPAAVAYLRHVYADTANATTLTESTGRALSDLDQEYRASFLPVHDPDLPAIQVSQSVFKLALGHCPISSQGLAQVNSAHVGSLTWLDLNHCHVDDTGLGWLERAEKMQQLSLEQTQITGKTLRQLAGMADLLELDLAGTQVSDADLEYLAGLPRLRVLWLTNTAVSDDGIHWLRQLPSLRQVDVTGTKVTPEGLARLGRERPALKSTGP